MKTLCLAVIAAPLLAVSTYKGLEPGASTQQDVIRAMGQPVRGFGTAMFEYGSANLTFVEFDGNGVVQRISMRFSSAQPKSGVLGALNIQGAPSAGELDAQGNLIEYFGGDHTAVVNVAGRDSNGAVTSVTFLSASLFAQQLNRLRTAGVGSQPGAGASPITPGNPAIPPPPPDEQLAKFTPDACREVYDWARQEQEPATKSKNAARRHAILEVRIAAQKGDCSTARTLADSYRSRYR